MMKKTATGELEMSWWIRCTNEAHLKFFTQLVDEEETESQEI